MSIKKKVVLLAIVASFSVSAAQAAYNLDGLVKRAEQGLSECAFELSELDKATMDEGQEPINPEELERLYREVDAEYGEGQGLAECLTNIDSILDYISRH